MMANQLHTNRDLYLFVAALTENDEGDRRELEEYLRALWRLGSAQKANDRLTLECFARLLADAFEEQAPAFEAAWRAVADEGDKTQAGYSRWERTIFSQIVDLRDMREAGMLANEHRYFGMDAPRGESWYNFDALTYLECAVEGTFGGWRPGDSTGRDYVHVNRIDPDDQDIPIFEIARITWDQFADFLRAGQWFE
jgi:hypothetical protein